VDYKQKYGMAYQLSNNNIGVHFNDNTKLVADNAMNYFYYERQGVSKVDSQLCFNKNQIPKHAKKKVLIHEKFVSYI
jgi:hypothetical protein